MASWEWGGVESQYDILQNRNDLMRMVCILFILCILTCSTSMGAILYWYYFFCPRLNIYILLCTLQQLHAIQGGNTLSTVICNSLNVYIRLYMYYYIHDTHNINSLSSIFISSFTKCSPSHPLSFSNSTRWSMVGVHAWSASPCPWCKHECYSRRMTIWFFY